MEDYFVGHGEDPGQWIGRGAETLGLSGEADIEGLSRLFGQGCDPVTGRRRWAVRSTGQHGGGRLRPVVFAAEIGVGPVGVGRRRRLGCGAGRATTPRSRRPWSSFGITPRSAAAATAGLTQEATGGLLAAVFVHRTSRAGDPQLHSHVLVANKVQAVSDGRWLSIDGRELYEVQKAAGMLYKALSAGRADRPARGGVERGGRQRRRRDRRRPRRTDRLVLEAAGPGRSGRRPAWSANEKRCWAGRSPATRRPRSSSWPPTGPGPPKAKAARPPASCGPAGRAKPPPPASRPGGGCGGLAGRPGAVPERDPDGPGWGCDHRSSYAAGRDDRAARDASIRRGVGREVIEALTVVLPTRNAKSAAGFPPGGRGRRRPGPRPPRRRHADLSGPARHPPRRPPLQHLVDPADRTSRPRRRRSGTHRRGSRRAHLPNPGRRRAR